MSFGKDGSLSKLDYVECIVILLFVYCGFEFMQVLRGKSISVHLLVPALG